MSARLTADQVEIADGLMLSDLHTLEDCQMAVLTLARDINRIEEQLAGPLAKEMADAQWVERAESALRFKKSLRQVVSERAAEIRRASKAATHETRAQRLVDQFKANWPVLFDLALRMVRDEHPELWSD